MVLWLKLQIFFLHSVQDRKYCEFKDQNKLTEVCNEYLDDYNNMFPSPMNLVLFVNAIEHCCRIARIIGQPGGNAMLVGVGGSEEKNAINILRALEWISINAEVTERVVRCYCDDIIARQHLQKNQKQKQKQRKQNRSTNHQPKMYTFPMSVGSTTILHYL